MSMLRKVKIAAGATVVVFAAHAYQSGAVATPAHHGSVAAPAALGGTPAQNEALANQMAASMYGWRGGQLTCLDDLWIHESGFRDDAANPTSDARGIPQKISGWSADYQPGDAAGQVKWGLLYVKGRYGTPCAAWAFEMSHTPNWY